jgi:hypothetical protein
LHRQAGSFVGQLLPGEVHAAEFSRVRWGLATALDVVRFEVGG